MSQHPISSLSVFYYQHNLTPLPMILSDLCWLL